jgi:hypothetical protein
MTPFRQRALILILIGLGLLIVGFFGLRTFSAFREFRGHRPPPAFESKQPETDVELIRDWMTIPFIGKMYHVAPPVIFDALGIPMKGNQEKSLEQLNAEYFPGSERFVEKTVIEVVLKNLPQKAPLPPTAPAP